MLKLGTVVMGAEDVGRAVTFWAAAMGYEPVAFPDSENKFTILVPPNRDGTRIALQEVETPPQDYPRVHIDLIVESSAEQQLEVDRLLSLGATKPDWDSYPADCDFVVLADPEGNRFCIVDASHG